MDNISETRHHSQVFESHVNLDVDIPKILEEQKGEVINNCLITEEDIPSGVDPMISPGIPTNDDSIPPSPHVSMVSQTQKDDEDDPPSDDDTGLNGLVLEEGVDLDTIAAHINVQLDEMGDILSAELEAIMDHIYLSENMELQVKYTNGNL